MKNKKIVLLIALIAFLIGLLTYINPLYLYRNYKLINHLETITTKEQLSPKELIPFEYDKAYIIYPYTTKKDIEKDLGIKSRYIKENKNDSSQPLLITKNNKIISSINISLYYSFQPLAEYNFISKKRDTIIKIYNTKDSCSFIEQQKNYKESFYDISYIVPGSYWEEDDEEPGKFYYLDIDSDEYLLVTKEDNFKLNKYIKEENITKREDLTINKHNIKYLESTNNIKNNTIDLIYIISINNHTYIFKLNSLKENIVKNKENLYNIIQSIKE